MLALLSVRGAASVETAPKETKPEPAAAGTDSQAEKNTEFVSVRLIADQTIFHGAPDGVLDLSHVFDKVGLNLSPGERPKLAVVHNAKPEVVEAILKDDILTLRWKSVGESEIVVAATDSHGKHVHSRFGISVWEPDYWALVLTVTGGLGIFLLGMKNMSEGLQAVAGSGLRRLISAVTDNRLLAVGTGVLVTMTIQSSSITTVMVVGFVNSSFMTLTQAIGVIMGANIGTTITAWIIALKMGQYGLPLVGLSAFVYLFSHRDRVRYTALACMGLGMVFFGLELMKEGFSVIKNIPEFEAWFSKFTADDYWGLFKCALVGSVITAIIQSSSATVGITMGLTQIGVIPYQTAAALVLGETIGTTITAWLASIGTTTTAKRAAYFHILFNVLGSIIFIPLFWWYLDAVQWVAFHCLHIGNGQVTPDNVGQLIALTHTGFNTIKTILFLPFVQLFANLLTWMIPGKSPKEKPHLSALDVRMVETPVMAIEQSRLEILRMARGCGKMMAWYREIVEQPVPDNAMVQKVFHREEVLDRVQDEIVVFLTHMLAASLPHEVTGEARRQIRMADEYESVSDYICTILKSHLKLLESGHRFGETDRQHLMELHDMVTDYLQLIQDGYEHRQPEVVSKAQTRGHEIVIRMKKLRQDFLDRMSQQPPEPLISIAFTAQLNAYRRVRDHALNVAEAIAGEK